MPELFFVPKFLRGKKPVKKRKPSRPLDGINRRTAAAQVSYTAEAEVENNAPPTRVELVAKATELHLKFSQRTSDKRLLEIITAALKKKED